MKYYIYISDAKVDMLYGQIPSKLRERIVAELKLDLKVVSVSLRERPNDEALYAKLNVVVDFLDKGGVGDVAAPESFFRGSMMMKWGLWRYVSPAEPRTVYFTGAEDDVIVGLGGSAKHLIGNAPSPTDFGLSASVTPPLLLGLARESQQTWDREDSWDDSWVGDVQHIWRRHTGVPERLEFLARRLLSVDTSQARVLLGTPIYVAYND